MILDQSHQCVSSSRVGRVRGIGQYEHAVSQVSAGNFWYTEPTVRIWQIAMAQSSRLFLAMVVSNEIDRSTCVVLVDAHNQSSKSITKYIQLNSVNVKNLSREEAYNLGLVVVL